MIVAGEPGYSRSPAYLARAGLVNPEGRANQSKKDVSRFRAGHKKKPRPLASKGKGAGLQGLGEALPDKRDQVSLRGEAGPLRGIASVALAHPVREGLALGRTYRKYFKRRLFVPEANGEAPLFLFHCSGFRVHRLRARQ